MKSDDEKIAEAARQLHEVRVRTPVQESDDAIRARAADIGRARGLTMIKSPGSATEPDPIVEKIIAAEKRIRAQSDSNAAPQPA